MPISAQKNCREKIAIILKTDDVDQTYTALTDEEYYSSPLLKIWQRGGCRLRGNEYEGITRQIRGIVVLIVILMCAVVYKIAATSPPTPGLREAQLTYETERIQLMQENLKRNNSMRFYAAIGLIGALNLSLLILSSGYARAKVKRSSVHTAHIGKHSSIPVHYKDIQHFYPIAVNLSLAEIEASSHQSA